MDQDAMRRAQQASRTAFLRKESQRQERAAAAVLQERLRELEQGIVPESLVEAELLRKRSQEVKAAEGLLNVARHRREIAGEQFLEVPDADLSTRPFSSEDAPYAAHAGSRQVQPSGAPSSPHDFVAMEEEAIAARVAAKDYVMSKTYDELQAEKVQALQTLHDTLQASRRALPIYSVRDALVQLIRDHNVVVMVGETGSGKTTQLLQYLYEEGFHIPQRQRRTEAAEAATTRRVKNVALASEVKEDDTEEEQEELRLICTQPRRIAAVSVAERVAKEVGSRCGSVVGYRVRFDDKSGPLTRILFVTDGMMLKEFTADPDLRSVGAIMVDEAHERSLNTDILLGLLRDITRRNPNLKVIVASATINATKFSSFFDGAPIFTVTGRTFSVETFFTEEPVADYITESAQTAFGLHLSKPMPGDILIFLPGQDAIEACAQNLQQYVTETQGNVRPLLILPVYSSLPPKEQARIYEPTPPGTRKVVIATNIAETSITIDGIVYVVDCGLCKQDFYDPRAMVEELRVVPTSQASATQRAGRAGRTQPGECYRLFTSYTLKNELPPETIPEILRCSMSAVVLQLKALGIHNLLQFDFIDPPSTVSLERALDHLFLLGAMKADGRLTVTGRRMAELPLEPSLSKCLTRACALGCGRHMAMAAAMLTLDSVFVNTRDPQEKQKVESAKLHLFAFGNGDVAGYVRVMEEWLRAGPRGNAFCLTYGIHPRSMQRARDVFDQILRTLDRIGLDLHEGDDEGLKTAVTGPALNLELLTKALLSGFFFNVSRMEADKRTYMIVRPMETGAPAGADSRLRAAEEDEAPTAEIHPSSFLFRAGMRSNNRSASSSTDSCPEILKERPPLVVFTQLRRTSKRFMTHVTAIASPEWVLSVAPVNYFQKEDLETGLRKRPRELL